MLLEFLILRLDFISENFIHLIPILKQVRCGANMTGAQSGKVTILDPKGTILPAKSYLGRWNRGNIANTIACVKIQVNDVTRTSDWSMV